jgi:hypothetical protein
LPTAAWLLLALAGTPAFAQEPVTFRGKTITMIVGSQAGGGTDATGRLMAPFLVKYLPGNPTVIVENRPGADGIVALNYFVQQVKPDGLTVAAGDSPQIDPIRYRAPQSRYDPTRFEFVGGIGRGGSMIIMDPVAEKRLSDKSAPPVTIGVASSVPRSGQSIAAWGIGFLGWNAKWVVGYRGTSALMLALQQGELDMTATSNTFSLQHLIDSGKFKVLVQSGGLQDGKLGRNSPTRRSCLTCSPASSTRSRRSRSTIGAASCSPTNGLACRPERQTRWSKPIVKPIAPWRPIPNSSHKDAASARCSPR